MRTRLGWVPAEGTDQAALQAAGVGLFALGDGDGLVPLTNGSLTVDGETVTLTADLPTFGTVVIGAEPLPEWL